MIISYTSFREKLKWLGVRIWAFRRGTNNPAVKLDSEGLFFTKCWIFGQLKMTCYPLWCSSELVSKYCGNLTLFAEEKALAWSGLMFGARLVQAGYLMSSLASLGQQFWSSLTSFLKCCMITWYIADGQQWIRSGGDRTIFPQLVCLSLS